MSKGNQSKNEHTAGTVESLKQQVASLSEQLKEKEKLNKELKHRLLQQERLDQIRETVIENANVWMDVLDTNANVIIWNRAAEQISGYSKEEVVGHDKIWEWLYPDPEYRREIFSKAMAIINKGQVVEDLETKIICKNGDTKIIAWHSRSLTDKEGNIIGSIALGRDITWRKRYFEELQKFKKISDNALFGVAISDMDGNLLYVNEYFARIHGYSSDELIGKNLSIFHSRAQMKTVERLNKQLRSRGSYDATEIWHVNKDGHEFPMLMSGVVIHDEDGKPRYMAATAIDITEQKRVMEELRQTQAYLEKRVSERTAELAAINERLKIENAQRLRMAETLLESEQRYHTIFNAANDAIFLYDPQKRRIVECNQKAVELFGYSHQEFYDFRFIKEMGTSYPYNCPELRNKIELALSQEPQVFELKAYNKSGETIWVDVSLQRAQIDKRDMILAVIRDITSRKQAEERLKQSEDLYRTLFEIFPDAVFIHSEGKLILGNQQGAELMGAESTDQMIGMPVLDFVHPDYKEMVLNRVKTMLTTGKSAALAEEKFVRFDGSIIDVEVVATPFEYKGKPAILGIARNITERKRAEEAIRRLNEDLSQRNIQLQESMEELDSFSYSISHDLRTPLRTINGYAHILTERYHDMLTPEAANLLDKISENTNKMGKLIDDLLAFSRLGRKKLKHTKIDMQMLFRTAFEDIEGYKTKVRFVVNQMPDAYGDVSMIYQVLANLLSNSIKYTYQNQDPTIEVGSEIIDGQKVYFVKDNGIGFDMSFHEKIFDVFKRLSEQPIIEGTGVGLAIVKRIIEKHGGKVWANSEPGKGSIFYFYLPDEEG